MDNSGSIVVVLFSVKLAPRMKKIWFHFIQAHLVCRMHRRKQELIKIFHSSIIRKTNRNEKIVHLYFSMRYTQSSVIKIKKKLRRKITIEKEKIKTKRKLN